MSSSHPLSLRKQVLLQFPSVEDVRFEFRGPSARFFVRPGPGSSEEELGPLVRKYLDSHRGIGMSIELAEHWEDGPTLPAVFQALTADEIALLEGCDGRKGELEAVLLQCCPWMDHVAVGRGRPGHLRLWVVGRARGPGGAGSEPDLRHVEALAVAASGHPLVTAEAQLGAPPADEAADQSEARASLPEFMFASPSYYPSSDPAVLRFRDEEEDFLRRARRLKYVLPGDELFPLPPAAAAVFLPEGRSGPDVRAVLPLHDRIFFPVPKGDGEQAPRLYGASLDEITDLIADSRCVPVFTHPLFAYSPSTIRRFTEQGRYVGPRRLTVSILSDSLASNPLWALALREFEMATDILRQIDAVSSQCEGDTDGRIMRAVRAWSRFTGTGCVDLDTVVATRGTLLPLSHGPGVIAGGLLPGVGATAEVALAFMGLEVARAVSLDATLFPASQGALGAYEVLLAATGRCTSSTLDRLTMSGCLTTLVQDLRISWPENIPVREWAARLDGDRVRDLRCGLSRAFRHCEFTSLHEVRAAAADLAAELEKYADAEKRTRRVVDRLDVVGLLAEAALWATDANFPFVGYGIGVAVKNLAPRLWERTAGLPVVRRGADLLAAANAFVPPHVARLHRVVAEVGGRVG